LAWKQIKRQSCGARFVGKNVNEDLFRFIQVGDAYFNEGVEISTRLVNINIRAKKEFG
jgi:hypothetical protein